MCGIVGSIAQRQIAPILVEGLRRLEYRGYDSTGIAVLDARGQIWRKRSVGKLKELEQRIATDPVPRGGLAGIAHARWATHGVPTERNAHPHLSRASVAVVHNGIIENHHELRVQLQNRGFEFTSDTDTEVIAHQIQDFLEQGHTLEEAVRAATNLFSGSYAIGVIAVPEPDRLVAARFGSPLVIGLGEGENFMASDVFALLRETRRFLFLEDGDIAVLTREGVEVHDQAGIPTSRPVKEVNLHADACEHAGHSHYMHKEIHEQPGAVTQTLNGRLNEAGLLDVAFEASAWEALRRTRGVHIVACGTSYHAGLIARHWIEAMARIPCTVEVASEYRYRDLVVPPGTLFVSISQSGETADTLAALSLAKRLGYVHTLALCNVAESSLVRASASSLMTQAGPEIGVASTKAFTTQLTGLALLVLALCRFRPGHPGLMERLASAALRQLRTQIVTALRLETAIRQWAQRIALCEHAIYLGRGAMYPVAMEGALKLKEISYIHAECFAAGELKHGPLALVDERMPVIALAPNNRLAEKLNSNLAEVRARGGQIFVLASRETDLSGLTGIEVIRLPEVDELTAPIVYSIPLQLLAYHVALLRGTDLDQPRNLAKSVTVE
ncbi:glutamine--fructose-6-phosphate transaminase (isomerizing) [Methyloterricola oryzae]|uniref:glutamine--fructose-6-phosphate transaminase (isomerizing) n=1 Tax=Methyloterricola oryzae TaxID=1495050 RepID=UPI0005EB39F6|nr:glutamine--fructose-6-phosphate transaminase (isomerizing) [Methyloterricola oryzae]